MGTTPNEQLTLRDSLNETVQQPSEATTSRGSIWLETTNANDFVNDVTIKNMLRSTIAAVADVPVEHVAVSLILVHARRLGFLQSERRLSDTANVRVDYTINNLSN